MNDIVAKEKPADGNRAAQNPTAEKSNASIMKRMKAFTKSLLTIAYPALTLLGFIYAYWYYKHFGISFLNHATPFDLLLVAFANANKIGIILSLAFCLALVVVLIFLVVLLCVWAIVLTIAILIVILSFVDVLRATVVVLRRSILAVGAAIVSPFVALARWSVIARSKGTKAAASWWRENADNSDTVMRHLRSLWYLWGRAWQSVKDAKTKLSNASTNFRKTTNSVFKQAMSVLKHGWVFLWNKKAIVFLVSLSAAAVLISVRAGQLDSECVSQKDDSCTFGLGVQEYFRDLYRYGKRSVSLIDIRAKRELPSGNVVIVSTSNIAALEYLPKQQEAAGRKHVRVTIRQNAVTGSEDFPICLTDLGATESAQFLFDFDDDGQRFADDERCQATSVMRNGANAPVVVVVSKDVEPGMPPPAPPPLYPPTVVVVDGTADPANVTVNWLPSCEMTLAAWVGPFAVGENHLAEKDAEGRKKRDCFPEVPSFQVEDGLGKLKEWLQRKESNESKEVRRLILVGRADREPIDNEQYPSNFALAQSRADWVRRTLLEARAKKPHVLSIPGGPATPEVVDRCDRVVEVHMCLESPRPGKESLVEGKTEDQDEQKTDDGGVDGA